MRNIKYQYVHYITCKIWQLNLIHLNRIEFKSSINTWNKFVSTEFSECVACWVYAHFQICCATDEVVDEQTAGKSVNNGRST